MEPDALVIADRTFTSRLIVGTGKYPSQQVTSDAAVQRDIGLGAACAPWRGHCRSRCGSQGGESLRVERNGHVD